MPSGFMRRRWSIPPAAKKAQGQKWILASMESDVNYPILRNRRFLRKFDLMMSYRLDSDIPAPYPTWRQNSDFLSPPRPFKTKVLSGAPWPSSRPTRSGNETATSRP